jgi:hypothetical protein
MTQQNKAISACIEAMSIMNNASSRRHNMYAFREPVFAAPELLDDQLHELLARQAFECRLQHLPPLHGAAIGQRQLTQRRVVLEQEPLELRQPLVLCRHRACVRNGLARVVVYGEVLVELEQVHKLPEQLPCSDGISDASEG